uniref:MEIOB-like N-terminal domain-containing protein n=1 Tax=Esox lucius TaxID=8010 RepID=A0AAY5KEY1_ESOLU
MANNGQVQDFVPISDLHPNTTHPRVAGVIIGKTDVKSFPDRKKIGLDRFTFGFTIKDSPDYFINVSSWGNDRYINGLSNSFSVGDCVIIENPLVATKDSEKDDRFCPSTPSFYRLMVSEAHSQLSICADIEIMNRLLPLLHLPVKDYRDFYSLGDIMANGQSLDGNVINILAVVRSVRPENIKYFTTADGRKGQRLEVKLFDDSVTSFPLVCWDREAIQLVQTLIPRETVLFISDARIGYDGFRNCMTATVNSKTIITVNPDTKEASLLFNYAREVSESGVLDEDDRLGDVWLYHQSHQKPVVRFDRDTHGHLIIQFICISPKMLYSDSFYFLLKRNNAITLITVVSSLLSSKCRYQVNEESQSCSNTACPGVDHPLTVTTGFDLLVDVTDHTGTLQSCSLNGTVAEKTLGCSHNEFANLTEDERTAIKWKFLLERCKVYFKITPSSKSRSGMRCSVLECSLADPGEVKQNMSALGSSCSPVL